MDEWPPTLREAAGTDRCVKVCAAQEERLEKLGGKFIIQFPSFPLLTSVKLHFHISEL